MVFGIDLRLDRPAKYVLERLSYTSDVGLQTLCRFVRVSDDERRPAPPFSCVFVWQ